MRWFATPIFFEFESKSKKTCGFWRISGGAQRLQDYSDYRAPVWWLDSCDSPQHLVTMRPEC